MIFKKGLLSDEDIKKEMGKNIFIHPFKEKNIRGASINLSVSKMAWLKDGDNIISAYDEKNDLINIPPHRTALIETDEIIHVTQILGGTFHSKVGVVAKGLGHIGTTLDPGWIGNCLITIHNHSNNDVMLNVGETFVSLKLFYVNTVSKFENNNNHGRPELLGNGLTKEDKKFFDEDIRTNLITLKEVFNDSSSYEMFKGKRKLNLYRNIFIFFGIVILGSIVAFVIYLYKNSLTVDIIAICASLISVFTGGYIAILFKKISNRL